MAFQVVLLKGSPTFMLLLKNTIQRESPREHFQNHSPSSALSTHQKAPNLPGNLFLLPRRVSVTLSELILDPSY